jgi:hypothetical protein
VLFVLFVLFVFCHSQIGFTVSALFYAQGVAMTSTLSVSVISSLVNVFVSFFIFSMFHAAGFEKKRGTSATPRNRDRKQQAQMLELTPKEREIYLSQLQRTTVCRRPLPSWARRISYIICVLIMLGCAFIILAVCDIQHSFTPYLRLYVFLFLFSFCFYASLACLHCSSA